MEIDWFGHSCFRVRTREVTVVNDPYEKGIGLNFPRPRADIITISHNHQGHDYADGVRGEAKVISGPGEYEIRGVFVTGVRTFHDKKNGRDRGKNTAYVMTIDGVNICHLGDLGHVPSQTQAESFGNIDVLFIPVGGVSTINASDAAEVVALFEPQIVIPMHYKVPDLAYKLDNVDKFIKEMGIKKPQVVETLKTTKDTLPKETQVVLLEMKQKD